MCEEIGTEGQMDQSDSTQNLSATQTSDMNTTPTGSGLISDDTSVPFNDNPNIVHDPNALAGENPEQGHSSQQYTETQGVSTAETVTPDSQYASPDELATKIRSMSQLEPQTAEKLSGEVAETEATGGRGKVSFGSCSGCSGSCSGSCSGTCSGSCDGSKTGRSCYYK